jgi:hypothetical protein
MVSEGQSDPIAGDTVAILLEAEDSDEDGLPDWWEQKFFDSPTGAIPGMDSDTNGRNNLEAFRQGQHPLQRGFQAQLWGPYLVLRREDDSVNLELLGFEGASYRLEESTDLRNWQPLAEGVLAGQRVTIAQANPSESLSVFFRAVVEEGS